MKWRTKIFPEKLNNFSKLIIKFPNFENIYIFPRTKKVILKENNISSYSFLEIIKCEVGKKLLIKIDDEEIYESDFDVWRILVK